MENVMWTAVIYNIWNDFSYQISGYAKDEEEAYNLALMEVDSDTEVLEMFDTF